MSDGRRIPAGARSRAVATSIAAALAIAAAEGGGGSGVARADTIGANGWTILTENDPQAQLVHLKIVVRSGALSDPAGLPGLAGFTARALLRGTATRPFQELNDAIERIGGTLGVRVGEDRVVLDGTVLASNFDAYLDVVRDVLTQPAFEPREMATLQQIVLGEIRAKLQDPRELAARALLARAYAGTALASPAEGTVDAVSRIAPADVSGFFKSRFVRQNLFIGVTSPFASDDIARRLTAKLDGIPQGALDARPLPQPALQGRRAVIVDRKGMATAPLFIAVPGIGDGDADWLSLDVGNFVFGDDFTSRLMQVLRAEHGWTYGAYSSYQQLLTPAATAGLFSLYTFPSVDSVSLSIPAALKLLDDYSKAGITADELAEARDSLANRAAFAQATAEQRLDLRIRELLTGRPDLAPDAYRQKISTLDLATVNGAIERRTPTSDLLLAVVGDATVLQPILKGLPLFESVDIVNVNP